MRGEKRLFGWLVAALLMLMPAGTGCLAKEIKLGFAHVALNNPYYIAMEQAARQTAAQMGASITIEVAHGDVVKQNQQIGTLLDAGVNALIVNSVSEYGTMASIKRAKEMGIPVVAIDRPLYGDYLCYVGIDQWRAGLLQGQYITERLLPQGGNIVMLLGVPGEPATIGRGNGMLNVVQHPKFAGKYKLLGSYRADYNMALGYDKMKEAIEQFGGQIDLVYGLNDAMVLGALKALREAGLTKVMVAGVDGQKEAYAEIATSGQYRSTVINNPSEITSKAVQILVEHLTSGKPPQSRDVITGTILVTPETVAKHFDPAAVF